MTDRPDLRMGAPCNDPGWRGGVQEAVDLLLETKRGSPARSAAHNARLVLQRLLATAPEPPVSGKVGAALELHRCFICLEPFRAGEMVLSDVTEGLGHRNCFGEDRSSYVKNIDTGEPLGPDDAIPTGEPYDPANYPEYLALAAEPPAAAAVPPAQGWQVRKLKWKRRQRANEYEAPSCVGLYEVGLVHGLYAAIRRWIDDDGQMIDTVIAREKSAGLAKAAAQANYEALIRPTIEPSPVERGHRG